MKTEPYLVRISKKNKSYFDLVREIIDKQLVYAKNAQKKLEPLKMPASNFTCDQCGICCDTAKTDIASDVFPVDLKLWMIEDLGICIASLGISTHDGNDYAMFIDRKEDYTKKGRFKSQKYKDEMVILNPSLALISDAEKQQCVFFNSLSNNCTIHKYRPLGCKCFPYYIGRDGVAGVFEKLCQKGCFKPEPVTGWNEIVKDVSVMYGNIHGVELFNKAKIGSMLYKEIPTGKFEKIADEIKSQNRMKSKKKQSNVLGSMLMNIVTIFYLLYPEYTNVDELMKEVRKK